jgi:flagellar biosynthesis protein
MYDKQEFLKRKAAALKYAQGSSAPKVVASGKGAIANAIIEKAQEFDVPFFKNEALANSLLDVNTGENIPPQLYKAVAEVFIWLLHSEKQATIFQKQQEEANNR